MTPGRKYRFTTRTDSGNGWIKTQEMVAVYLADDRYTEEHMISFRPLAGTSHLRASSIVGTPTLTDDPISLPVTIETHRRNSS